MPFGTIQFPLWEYLKLLVRRSNSENKCEPFQSAICGAIAGKSTLIQIQNFTLNH